MATTTIKRKIPQKLLLPPPLPMKDEDEEEEEDVREGTYEGKSFPPKP